MVVPVVPMRERVRLALTLRADDAVERARDGLAGAERRSRPEVIRRAVLERWARFEHRARVRTAVGEGPREWHEALDRLGTA